jgi:curli biogenesis system outer membrane secretion channel CsgG
MKRLTVVLFISGLVIFAGCALGPSLRSVKPIDYSKRGLVAVGDLQNLTGKPEYDSLLDGLTGSLIVELHGTECFRVIERQRLKSIMEEMKLGMTGLTDPAKTKEVGKMIGADAILFVNLASVTYDAAKTSAFIVEATMEKVEMTLDARLVSVEKGEILAASKIVIPYSNFYGSGYFGLMKAGEKADQKVLAQKALEGSIKHLAREIAWQVSKRNR